MGLFILGTIFCYLIILPPAFEWLTDQASGFATIMPEASRWVDIIIKFEIGFGFGFELPLIVFYLVMFNIISYDKLRKSWRYVYIGLLIFRGYGHAGCFAGNDGPHVRRARFAL